MWLCSGVSLSGAYLVELRMQHLPDAKGMDDMTDDSSDVSSGGHGRSGGCPLGLDVLRFPWCSPLGFSLARWVYS